MVDYSFIGQYFEKSVAKPMCANIGISDCGYIDGVLIDTNSEVKSRQIKGSIKRKNNSVLLDFLVVVPEVNVQNYRYFLSGKNINAESFSGVYVGTWINVDKFTSVDLKIDLFAGESFSIVEDERIISVGLERLMKFPVELTLSRIS